MPRPIRAIHFIIGCILASTSAACGQEFKAKQQTQLLKRFPQFDKDGDGKLSESEQKTLLKQILKRYPQADRDGDGVLSEDEKQKLRQMSAARGSKSPSKSRSDIDSGKTDPKSVLSQLGLKGELDIEYRKNTKQQQNRLDFIYPKTKVYEQAPLFIYIHGGGNTGGTKDALYRQGALILKELTEAGIAVATIDYRVFGKGEELSFHHLFEDCKDALRFLAKNSGRFGIDRHKFVTWGTSAGGSKALITALTDSDFLPGENTGPENEHTVIGAISFYGATTYMVPELWQKRLERFPSRSKSKAEMMLKPSNGMSVEKIKKMISADQHLNSDSPPILLVHGDTDPTLPLELSKHLYDVAKNRNIDVKLVEVKNAGHGFKPIKGNPAQPSLTWEESQRLVIKQIKDWVK